MVCRIAFPYVPIPLTVTADLTVLPPIILAICDTARIWNELSWLTSSPLGRSAI